MPDNDAWVSKDDVADLEGLFERLKNYQNALVHKYPFAASSRAEAAVAFGTARPALERLYPGGTDGVTQMVGALRIVRPTDDHDAVLAEVERAIQDLGALIATVKRQLMASRSVHTPIAMQPAHTLLGATKDTGSVTISSPDESARNEHGQLINGVGDTPPIPHEILTGSKWDGRAYDDSADHTCNNWTSSTSGSAQAGHSDRIGNGSSWNSSNATTGCSQAALESTGGAGLFYCFAIN